MVFITDQNMFSGFIRKVLLSVTKLSFIQKKEQIILKKEKVILYISYIGD